MTISSTVARVDYTGNGVTTAFPVTFPFFDASELRVVSRVIATGVETVQTLTTNYTVSGGGGTTGTVTAVAAPASTVQWSILRNTRRTQDVDYQANDPFPAETHERALDRVVAVVQEIERDTLRSLRVAESDSTSSLTLPTQATRASRVLGFDVNGNPVAVVPEAGSLSVTPYALNILSSGDAATARGVLGALGTYSALAATTSGSSVGISGIPAGVRWVDVMLVDVRTSTSVQVDLQLGTGGGPTYITTGYVASAAIVDNAAATIAGSSTTGFPLGITSAARVGVIRFRRVVDNYWLADGHIGYGTASARGIIGGAVDIGAELTAVRLTTAGAFNLGSARITWGY